jgi:hypothetical protein
MPVARAALARVDHPPALSTIILIQTERVDDVFAVSFQRSDSGTRTIVPLGRSEWILFPCIASPWAEISSQSQGARPAARAGPSTSAKFHRLSLRLPATSPLCAHRSASASSSACRGRPGPMPLRRHPTQDAAFGPLRISLSLGVSRWHA